MASWQKGSKLALIWGVGFVLFIIFLLVLIIFLNGWELDFSEPRSWLPLVLALVLGTVFEVSFFFLNKDRQYLFSSMDWETIQKKVESSLHKKEIPYTTHTTEFRRVPWRRESSLEIRTEQATIIFIEKTTGSDIVINVDAPEYLKNMVEDLAK